jgi:hypothetical protein
MLKNMPSDKTVRRLIPGEIWKIAEILKNDRYTQEEGMSLRN